MKIRNGTISMVVLLSFAILNGAAHGAAVTTTNDSGPGSLRDAIINANAASTSVTIDFGIPGAGPHVIAPTNALPMLNGNINIVSIGAPLSNGAPTIILDGSLAGANANGLTLGSFVVLSGLGITGFSDAGVLISTNQTGTTISSCLISGNGGPGIRSFGNINQILNNTITANGEDGVVVFPTATRNRISQNSIYLNGGLTETNAIGIDLLPGSFVGGVTPNDGCDADSGGNNLQNFPVLTSATSDGIITTVAGSINSTASRLFVVEFFANVSCDVSGNGEGESYIGSTNITTDVSCGAPINAILPVGLADGVFITATATDGNFANTSEFSPCVRLTGTAGHPVASNDVYTTNQDTVTNVPAPGVLANDTDPDGDPLTAVQVTGPTHASSFTLNSDGSFDYTPTNGFSGLDIFTYHANDGTNDSADATVVISVGADTPAGTPAIVQFDASPVGTIDITFAGATTPGTTTIVPIDPSQAGTVPGNFTLYNNIVFDITTTATVTPPIDICFTLPSVTDPNVWATLQVMHNEGGTLTNRTFFSDFVLKQICGRVTSLSPFAIAVFDAPPAEPHDLTVTTLKAPKKVTLKEGSDPKPGKLQVAIQNLGPTSEVISNATVLANFVQVNIESLGKCTAPVPTLVAPTVFPITLAPKKKLKLSYTVTIDCANDELQGVGHEDYRYTVTLDRTALDGLPDSNSTNDICPRAASGIDKGCNKGVDALTDVIMK